MIYQSNTTGATNGEGTAYPSGAPEFALVFSGIRVVHVVKLHVFMFLASYCDVHLFCRGFTLYVCYLYLYQMVFVLVKCNTSLVKQKLITIHEHPTSSPIFSGVRVSQSLVVCVVFCRSLFVLLPFCRFYFGHCIVCPSIYRF